MQSWQFYSKHLEKVSRSFSFCIAQLPATKREWVALAYLLFRVADTIEDSSWENSILQQETFSLFDSVLTGENKSSVLSHWQETFPKNIDKGEYQLLYDTVLLIDDLFLIPSNIQKQLIKNIRQMMAGMCYFLAEHTHNGKLSLNKLTLLNQYCFFVAGIVGELLTFIFSDSLKGKYDDCLRTGFHFGLFLQKINILKDQLIDESLGRQFISSRAELKQSVLQHAKYAFSYIQSISSESAKEYRLFCAWSLFIGLASLKWIEKHFVSGKHHKISYVETMSIVYKLKQIIEDDKALEVLFNGYLNDLNETLSQQPREDVVTELPLWFQEIYPSKQLASYANELGLL